MKVLGAHMLEVCPSIADGKPCLEIHPLGIGGKADPVRLVFNVRSGPAINASLIDMGNRFRMIVNEVDVVPAGCAAAQAAGGARGVGAQAQSEDGRGGLDLCGRRAPHRLQPGGHRRAPGRLRRDGRHRIPADRRRHQAAASSRKSCAGTTCITTWRRDCKRQVIPKAVARRAVLSIHPELGDRNDGARYNRIS